MGSGHGLGRRVIGVHDVIGLVQNGETIDGLIADRLADLTRAGL